MKRFKKPLLAGVCLGLLAIQPYRSSAANETPSEKKPTIKSRTRSSRNNHAVRIYPDVLKRVMHVVAKNNKGKQIDFFVFDVEGTLIQHYKMSAGDHQRLESLERGKYVYNVFAGDEETASGQFQIR